MWLITIFFLQQQFQVFGHIFETISDILVSIFRQNIIQSIALFVYLKKTS